jgi:hypothetical protein
LLNAVINLRGVSTNNSIICFIAMQTYKINKFIIKVNIHIRNQYIVVIKLLQKVRVTFFNICVDI